MILLIRTPEVYRQVYGLGKGSSHHSILGFNSSSLPHITNVKHEQQYKASNISEMLLHYGSKVFITILYYFYRSLSQNSFSSISGLRTIASFGDGRKAKKEGVLITMVLNLGTKDLAKH